MKMDENYTTDLNRKRKREFVNSFLVVFAIEVQNDFFRINFFQLIQTNFAIIIVMDIDLREGNAKIYTTILRSIIILGKCQINYPIFIWIGHYLMSSIDTLDLYKKYKI